MPPQKRTPTPVKDAASYRHPEVDLLARPEIGAQAHFKKIKAPATYRLDSSLAPELCWDGQNPAREHGDTKEARLITPEEKANPKSISTDWRPFQLVSLSTGNFRPNMTINFEFEGQTYHPGPNKHWRTGREGLERLASLGRIVRAGAIRQIRPPAKTLALSAEALIGGSNGGDGEPVAILFGPADGPLSERFVREAWDEAGLKHYTRLFVIGLGIDPKAREFVEKAGQIGMPCVYLEKTAKGAKKAADDPWEVELLVVKKLEVKR
jgi:hypothetical protein